MAAALWTAEICVLRAGTVAAWLLLIPAVMAVGVGFIGYRRRRPRSGAIGLLMVVGLGLAAAAAVAGPRVAMLSGDPWHTLIRDRAMVTVVAEVVSTPAVVTSRFEVARSDGRDAGAAAASPQLARVAVTQLDHGRGRVTLRAPAELLVTGTAIARGQLLSVRVRVGRARAGSGLAASLTGLDPPEVLASSPGDWLPLADQVRGALPQSAPDRRELIVGMVSGDDSRLSREATDSLRTSGLSHLTAVSGANIAVVAAVLALVCRSLGLPRWVTLGVGVVGVGAYTLAVGPEPSVLRAAAMAAVALLGIVVGGGTGMAGLVFAVVALLMFDPWLAVSAGFALSCAATCGLVCVAPAATSVVRSLRLRLPFWLGPLVAAVVGGLWVTLAAQLATAPVLLALGDGLSVVSPAVNLAAGPAVPIATVAGLGLAVASPWASGVLAPIAEFAASWILGLARAGSAAPMTALPIGGGAVVVVGFALLAAGGLAVARLRPWLGTLAAALVAIGSAVALRPPAILTAVAPTDWVAIFCDVGQGDAVLLRTGPDSAVMVDTGPEPTSAGRCLRRARVGHLDALVLTHFHRDHVGGMTAVLADHRPVQVVVGPLHEPPATYREVSTQLTASGLRPRVGHMAEVVRVGWLRWRVLWPARVIRAGSAPNNASVCLLATVAYGGSETTILLSGDLETEAQAALMARSSPIAVDVVKVPHHGSKRVHPGLPRWVRAPLAVISVGADNDYGHPAPATERSWRRSGAQVLRTDQGGDVILLRTATATSPTGGRSLQVMRSKPEESGSAGS